MKENKLTPLEKLKQEKRQLRRNYQADEERLSQNWNYLSNNIGSLFLHTALNGIKGSLGIKNEEKEEVISQPTTGLTVLSAVVSSLPVIWEFAQPMLIGFAIKKVKNIFTSKGKKNKKIEE